MKRSWVCFMAEARNRDKIIPVKKLLVWTKRDRQHETDSRKLLNFLDSTSLYQSYSATKEGYSPRKGKNDPKSNWEIITAAFLVSKDGTITSMSTGQSASTCSLGGRAVQNLGAGHVSSLDLQEEPSGEWPPPTRATGAGQLPTACLGLEDRTLSQRGLFSSLKI